MTRDGERVRYQRRVIDGLQAIKTALGKRGIRPIKEAAA